MVEKSNLELPVAYRLVEYDEVRNLRETAIDLAQKGDEEGTLIWARNQTDAKGWLGKKWITNEQDLHCSIILRPDFEFDKYAEVILVAAVSLAHALATHLSAMTALNFSWPNDLTVAGHKVASIWIDADPVADQPWLVVTASVNLINAPEDFSIPAMSIKEAEGQTDLTVEVLLETYARQFISQINNWSDRGSNYIVNQWKIRDDGTGKQKTLYLKDKRLVGLQQQIGPKGEMILEIDDGEGRVIPISEFINQIAG